MEINEDILRKINWDFLDAIIDNENPAEICNNLCIEETQEQSTGHRTLEQQESKSGNRNSREKNRNKEERKHPREPSLISTQEEPKRPTILSSSKSIKTKRKKPSELYPILYKLLKKTSPKNENITVPTSDVPKAHSPIVNNENQNITARHSTVHSQGQTSATLFAAIDSSPIQRYPTLLSLDTQAAPQFQRVLLSQTPCNTSGQLVNNSSQSSLMSLNTHPTLDPQLHGSLWTQTACPSNGQHVLVNNSSSVVQPNERANLEVSHSLLTNGQILPIDRNNLQAPVIINLNSLLTKITFH